jgi:hypothetical protein
VEEICSPGPAVLPQLAGGAAALSDGNLLMNEDFDEKIHERLQ